MLNMCYNMRNIFCEWLEGKLFFMKGKELVVCVHICVFLCVLAD